MTRREAMAVGQLWKQAAESGMSEREIIVLQYDHSRDELAKMFQLSVARIAQIRAKAKRKMRHPRRRKLCVALGLAQKVGLELDDAEEV
jgi:DNA-binding CsgD family transcriptional regulator